MPSRGDHAAPALKSLFWDGIWNAGSQEVAESGLREAGERGAAPGTPSTEGQEGGCRRGCRCWSCSFRQLPCGPSLQSLQSISAFSSPSPSNQPRGESHLPSRLQCHFRSSRDVLSDNGATRGHPQANPGPKTVPPAKGTVQVPASGREVAGLLASSDLSPTCPAPYCSRGRRFLATCSVCGRRKAFKHVRSQPFF